MTVKELIMELHKMDPEKSVVLSVMAANCARTSLHGDKPTSYNGMPR